VDATSGTHLRSNFVEHARELAARFASVNARAEVADRDPRKKSSQSSQSKYPARTAANTKAASTGLDFYA
jgi:hypothetical protein